MKISWKFIANSICIKNVNKLSQISDQQITKNERGSYWPDVKFDCVSSLLKSHNPVSSIFGKVAVSPICIVYYVNGHKIVFIIGKIYMAIY